KVYNVLNRPKACLHDFDLGLWVILLAGRLLFGPIAEDRHDHQFIEMHTILPCQIAVAVELLFPFWFWTFFGCVNTSELVIPKCCVRDTKVQLSTHLKPVHLDNSPFLNNASLVSRPTQHFMPARPQQSPQTV